MIGQATAFFGWLDPAVAKELLDGAPNVCAATVFAPTGRAVPAGDDNFNIEGRWTFASGCLHSELVQLGVFVMDGHRPALRGDGSPDWRFAYVRTRDVEIVDTWDPLGLRGTGSNDIVVREMRVPVEHMGMPMLDPPKTDDGFYQLGFWGHTAVVLGPFPLGVARRAFDELEALLPTKVARGGQTPLVQDPQVQYEIGRCRGALGAARSFLDDAVGQAWNRICAGDPASDADQQRLRLAMQHAMTVSLETIDVAYRFAGTSVLGRQSPLQRCFRDLHTARTHFAFGLEVYRKTGRRALGVEPPG
jgi:alkylation response protein AidB-like acyl-CoA dehydrogenase